MKIKHLSLFAFLLVSLSFTACKKEKGCMNPDPENYSATAEEDDGSCVFSRDKFLADWGGDMVCGAPVGDVDDFTIRITEDLSSIDAVEISFLNTGELVIPALTGTVSGGVLTIPEQTHKVPIDPANPSIQVDTKISGEGTITDATMDGTMELFVIIANQAIACTFTAMK